MYFILPTTTLQAIFNRVFWCLHLGWISIFWKISVWLNNLSRFTIIPYCLMFFSFPPYILFFNFFLFTCLLWLLRDMIRFLILLLLILKLFLLFFEWVGSWCSVTRAVIFFLMNSLFEEKCSSGCPKTINKFRSNSWNSFGWKNNNFTLCYISKTAR